jgi:hypothetical protein
MRSFVKVDNFCDMLQTFATFSRAMEAFKAARLYKAEKKNDSPGKACTGFPGAMNVHAIALGRLCISPFCEAVIPSGAKALVHFAAFTARLKRLRKNSIRREARVLTPV